MTPVNLLIAVAALSQMPQVPPAPAASDNGSPKAGYVTGSVMSPGVVTLGDMPWMLDDIRQVGASQPVAAPWPAGQPIPGGQPWIVEEPWVVEGCCTPPADSCGCHIDIEFLWIRPRQRAFIPELVRTLDRSVTRLVDADFDRDLAIRTSVGGRFSPTNGYEFEYTFLRNDSADLATTSPDEEFLNFDDVSGIVLPSRLELESFDATLSHRFRPHDLVQTDVFGGLRVAWLKQQHYATARELSQRTRLSAMSFEFDGAGPMLGTTVRLCLADGVTGFLTGSGSLVSGRLRHRALINDRRFTEQPIRSSSTSVQDVIPIGTLAIGLEGKRPVYGAMCSAAIGYELSTWFGANRQLAATTARQTSHDLSLEGCFLRLELAH